MTELDGLVASAEGLEFRGRVTFSDRIEELEASAQASDDYILPGFIDLQVNGSDAVDVMAGSAEALGALGLALAREGTTGYLPTAITSPLETIVRVHDAVARAMEAEADSGGAPAAAILGLHLEGPFISPARLGAHPPLNLEPRGEPLERVLALARLRLVTLAPELEGALAAIERLTARGIVVSLGHSDATLEQARAAVLAGARMFTHVFNAMRPLHHREPGVAGAALSSDALAAVIPDGVHVHPEMLRLVWRARGAEGMALTTDKVAAEAQGTGGAARLSDGTLAGSVISMLEGVRLMVGTVGVPVAQAAMMAAGNPARILGLDDRGVLRAGARADILLLDRELRLKAVFVGGRELR